MCVPAVIPANQPSTGQSSCIAMRTLGFIGIFLLFLFVLLMLLISVHDANWGGVGIAAVMIGALVFCTRVLWRGRRLEREGRADNPADDWGNRSVSSFFSEQVAKSPEGRVLLAGSGVSFLLAIVAFVSPATIALRDAQAGSAIATFILWPLLAFVMYIQICGPDYTSSLYKRIAMLGVMCVPLYMIYK